jgi:hypothetical protein
MEPYFLYASTGTSKFAAKTSVYCRICTNPSTKRIVCRSIYEFKNKRSQCTECAGAHHVHLEAGERRPQNVRRDGNFACQN